LEATFVLRTICGISLLYLLVLLLVTSAPAGSTEGPHGDQLVHLLVPHRHLADGRIVTVGFSNSAASEVEHQRDGGRPDGPALGAGATAEIGDSMVTSLCPVPGFACALPLTQQRVTWGHDVLPLTRSFPPPDPPPNV